MLSRAHTLRLLEVGDGSCKHPKAEEQGILHDCVEQELFSGISLEVGLGPVRFEIRIR